jgi:hypothetical protein
MTHHETTHCPDEILAAIPWYPEEIDENLRGEVESHASQCPACRDELSFIRDDKGIEINVEKRDRVYAKLLERIEEHEGVEREREPRVTPDSRRGDTRLAWPVALAASLALALVSGGLGVAGSQWFQTAPDAAPYQVAGDSTTIVAAGPALDVVFRAEAKAESIHCPAGRRGRSDCRGSDAAWRRTWSRDVRRAGDPIGIAARDLGACAEGRS